MGLHDCPLYALSHVEQPGMKIEQVWGIVHVVVRGPSKVPDPPVCAMMTMLGETPCPYKRTEPERWTAAAATTTAATTTG